MDASYCQSNAFPLLLNACEDIPFLGIFILKAKSTPAAVLEIKRISPAVGLGLCFKSNSPPGFYQLKYDGKLSSQ